jgi:hypothetical protein
VLGTLKNLLVILLSEMPRQLMNPAEMEFPTRNHARNAGKTTGRTTCSDASRRNRFRHMKTRRAESEHRGARVLQVQLASVDLRDVREHGGGVAAVLLDQGGELAEQMLFVELPKR